MYSSAEGPGGELCPMYDDVQTDLKSTHTHTHRLDTHNRTGFNRGFLITDLGVVGAASRLERGPIP